MLLMLNPTPTEPYHTPQQWRALIGQRLATRRGQRSKQSCVASGISTSVLLRLERGHNRVVPMERLYFLCRHYGASLGALLEPGADRGGTWPEKVPSYPDADAWVRRSLRMARFEQGVGTKRLSAACRTIDPRVHQSWLVRVEMGDLVLDAVRLATVAAFLGTTLPKLLPEPLR